MTDAQIMKALDAMPAPQIRELAAKLGYTERAIYLWAYKPPTRKAVRAALEKALGGKR